MVSSPDFGPVKKRKRKGSETSPRSSLTQPSTANGVSSLQIILKPMPLPDKCNCSKSKCLKLYCECFAKGRFCGIDCSCTNCHNKEGLEDVIKQAKADIMKRDPDAFVKKLENNKNKL